MSPPARGQSVRPGVSLLSDVLECRVRLLSHWSRHVQLLSPWMTYTEPLSAAAGVGSFQLDTCWFGRAPGGGEPDFYSRATAAAGRHWSSWPRQRKSAAAAPRPVGSAPGGADSRSGSFQGWQSKFGRANNRHHHQQWNFTSILEAPGAPMMYTITRGPSKLVTQRRTGRYRPMMQCDIIRLSRLRLNWMLIQRLRWITVLSWHACGRFWTVFVFQVLRNKLRVNSAT